MWNDICDGTVPSHTPDAMEMQTGHPGNLASMRWLAIVTLGIASSVAGQATPSNPPELDATWTGADVGIPTAYAPEDCSGRVAHTCLRQINSNRKLPVVVFLHGCSGPNPEAVKNFLRLGYVVVEPNSMARPERFVDCSSSDKKNIMRLRFEEATYSSSMLKRLPWTDEKKLVLAGFSEGGAAAALYPGHEFSARIILGWTCSAPDPWWQGIRGLPDSPVLAVVGSEDPYYKNTVLAGHCAVEGRPDSKSIIIKGAFHNLLTDWETWPAVKDFLERATR
jgi:dienelactone hydrolase